VGGDLDEILIDTECPRCGATVRGTYGDVKLTRALACDCGALIKVDLTDTRLDEVQRLLNEVSVPRAENDPG
jgi:hypothetical protein